MSDLEICYLSATEALAAFRKKSLSPVELLNAQLERIAAVGSDINAFSFLYADEAIAAAKEAERRYSRGTNVRPLEGIPLAIKDESLIAGKITTFGSLIFKDEVASVTSPVNEHLIDAGAVVMGRTTTPEFSCAGFTHSRLWGVTRNPWNREFTTGGSSGGSAAALAAGFTTLASGSDIGGSIRIPASACGLVGYKPPYGRNADLAPFSFDFYNHPGPLARSVGDCILMQNVMSGPHPLDVASLRPKIDVKPQPADMKSKRISYSIDLGFKQVSEDVRKNTVEAINRFRDMGAEVVEVDLGWTERAEEAARDYLASIFGTWVAQYLHTHGDDLCGYTRTFAESARAKGMSEYLRSLEVAGEMYQTFGPMMETFDAFICPSLAIPAVSADFDPANGLQINGQDVEPMLGWLMTHPFNTLSRCPVVNMPSGRAPNGVPTGIQIVGKTYCDQEVLSIALAYEAEIGAWYGSDERRPALG
ncbi:MAG: amidase [Mesorhizobium sp.]|uniref:amidase n=1 Tax=Mesorhizobium sp. TaxID=1871066 RepID=UPI000FE2FDA4|nr:amidase [Mesorhizobium sp.]RWA74009.1 MAG: amidase [Mesorhizobium sp.]RWC05188.1 MAG: amidase [Mesorhizobium sp.]RWK09642.1 MAG: amidase [Mesorhizobium sp.]RWK13238.1 MAG: amidase [Mesorhizobium sp.]TIQ45078.1 MAG: amidase [Mesorhizobium sp.]